MPPSTRTLASLQRQKQYNR